MRPFLASLVALFTLLSLGFVATPNAEPTEKRIALVIGNAAYRTRPLPTSANDAGLIAQTLQAAGFDVVGARDLDQESLRRALREFLDKASSAGPDTVAFLYLSGYGLQLEGENYFVPVDANIRGSADVPAEALRLSDYLRPLGSLKLKGSMVVLDAARANPFSMPGEALAGGLALIEPSPGMLIAFSAAPGTIARERDGPYGAYAQALAEMMREGGLVPRGLFERVRLRVNDTTKGAQVPWSASKMETSFLFFEHSADAPAAASAEQTIVSRPLRELAASDAYPAAVERDTIDAYEEFLAAYPDDPMARRVRALLAARREATIWRLTVASDTPQAYWSYLRRYLHGPHRADALRRLALRAYAAEPPASFAPIDYDVPAPAPEELPYVERPALEFADADFPPPPPLPIYFLSPPPVELIELEPPLPAVEILALPIPVFVPIPVWCHRPAYVAPPPENLIFNNIHNRVAVDQASRGVTIKNHSGEIVSSGARSAHGALGLGAALPASLVSKAASIRRQQAGGQPQGTPSASWRQHPTNLPLGRPLPGADGRALPRLQGRLPGTSVTPNGSIAAPTPRSLPGAPAPGQGTRPQAAIPHQFFAPPRPTAPRPQWQPPSGHSGLPPLAPPARTYRPPAPSAPAGAMPPPVQRVIPTAPAPAYRPQPQSPAHSAFGLAAPSRPQVSAPPAVRIAPPTPPAARIAPPPIARIAPPPPAFRPPAPAVQAPRIAPPAAPVYRPPPPPPAPAAHAAVSRPAPPKKR
jgi:uncharacterized caspase-like protein